MSQFPDAKQLFTTVTEDGKSILSVEPYEVPELKDHEVVVQMEAVPNNPSDLGLLRAMKALVRLSQPVHPKQPRG